MPWSTATWNSIPRENDDGSYPADSRAGRSQYAGRCTCKAAGITRRSRLVSATRTGFDVKKLPDPPIRRTWRGAAVGDALIRSFMS